MGRHAHGGLMTTSLNSGSSCLVQALARIAFVPMQAGGGGRGGRQTMY